MRHPQLNPRGELTHVLTTEGLSRARLHQILDLTETIVLADSNAVPSSMLLQEKKIVFITEDSLAQHQSTALNRFERAAQRALAKWCGVHPFVPSAAFVDVDDQADVVVVETNVSGVPFWLAEQLGPEVHVINAGDGSHAHPVDALIDMFLIRRKKREFANLTVVLVGAVSRSGRARSCMHALTTLCVAEVRVVAPLSLLPEGLAQLGVRACTQRTDALKNADVIIMLEPHDSEIKGVFVPSLGEFNAHYGLTTETLACAKPDCLVVGFDDTDKERAQVGEAVCLALLWLVSGGVT